MKNNKAIRYDDGREGDAIGRALRATPVRRFEDGGTTTKVTSPLFDKNRDGTLSTKEKQYRRSMIKKYGSLDKARTALKKKKTARKKQRKADAKRMGIDAFKEQRAARMDQISDKYNAQINALIEKGYVERDPLVKEAYQRVQKIDNVGDNMLKKAKNTAVSVNNQYKDAKNYDKTDFSDIEQNALDASDYEKVGFDDVEDMARDANYQTTDYGDLEDSAQYLGDYDPTEFESEDYTTEDIQSRMSPYEQLVAERARQRLLRDFNEGRGQREAEAARAGAFGGSAAAVKEMADRRNYREALADLNAESLQKAYESGAQLTQLADDSRYRSDAAQEEANQFAANLGLQGWEAQLTARNATSGENARLAQQQLSQAELTGNLRQQAAAEEANQTQYALQGTAQQQTARDAAANEVARAKEAELAGIAGQGTAAQLMGQLSDQELDQYMQKTNAMNQYGTQDMNYELTSQEYPLSLMERNMNINTSALSGTPLNTTPQESQPSTAQTWLGYAAAAAPIVKTVADIAFGAAGGSVNPQGFRPAPSRMMGGGPVQQPGLIVNLANGGIVDLHRAMFRRTK